MSTDVQEQKFDDPQEAQKAFLRGDIGQDELAKYFDEDELGDIVGAKRIKEDIEEKDTSEILMSDVDLSP